MTLAAQSRPAGREAALTGLFTSPLGRHPRQQVVHHIVRDLFRGKQSFPRASNQPSRCASIKLLPNSGSIFVAHCLSVGLSPF
jgi:hypothetical protein